MYSYNLQQYTCKNSKGAMKILVYLKIRSIFTYGILYTRIYSIYIYIYIRVCNNFTV